jgi:hypothetical protein
MLRMCNRTMLRARPRGDAAVTLVRILYIGGPTAVIEIGPWCVITDPTFDPPGKRYFFGWGTASRKLHGPAIEFSKLVPIDAVLLSHDHHADNLDRAGRELLPQMGTVVTTDAGAHRLGAGARGLAPWKTPCSKPTGARRSRSPRRRAVTDLLLRLRLLDK